MHTLYTITYQQVWFGGVNYPSLLIQKVQNSWYLTHEYIFCSCMHALKLQLFMFLALFVLVW